VGQLSDPYQQGEDDELGITISGLPGEPHEPDTPPGGPDAVATDAVPADEADAASAATPDDGGDDDGDGVEFDLDDWSEIERQAVTDRLREAGIPHGWEGTTLLVAAVDEAPVDNVLDLVEGEAAEPLDADRDQVAYDLSEWDDDLVTALADGMREAGIAYGWDGDELFVYADDEQAVDELFNRVAHPHELAAEDDDGPAGAELLGEVFVAADRLQHDGEDHEGTVTMLDMAKVLEGSDPPYGLDKAEWEHLCQRVVSLGELLQAESLDDDAVMARSGELRTALRPYV
jgi:hypothetical protein